MNITRLDVSLESYEIGLSGAIPERINWSEPAMDRGILEFVSLFSGIVLKYGGRIVHGCHPTFTPIILRQARLHARNRLRKPLTLVMSELWLGEYRADEIEAMTDVAEFIVTKKQGDKDASDAETRNRSLSAMRRVLIDAQNVTVAVGGLLHKGDGLVAGVAEEIALAEQKDIPRFLIGGLGGLTQAIAADIAPSRLKNALPDATNVELFATKDVAASVNVLFEHLVRSAALVEATLQPIKWNPGNSAIIDHRDGSVDKMATDFILQASAV
jgi:hypothetical protein